MVARNSGCGNHDAELSLGPFGSADVLPDLLSFKIS
jgi:hypothetical protein